MKMKCSKSFIVTVGVLLLVGGRLWYHWNEMAHAPVISPFSDAHASDLIMNWRMSHGKSPLPTNSPPTNRSSDRLPHNLGFREKANEMSDAEKAEMTNLFVTKLKPAVEKWALVYSNRVPFNLADLSMDRGLWNSLGGIQKFITHTPLS